MEQKCATCKFYEPINHRGQRYPKGKCLQHGVSRISDGYQYFLTITSPHEYVCDLHEPAPEPTYALDGGTVYIVPPSVVEGLISSGWVKVKMQIDGEKTFIRKETQE